MSYIVVEGLDLTGKTRLTKKIEEHYNCESVFEPFGCAPISRTIYDILKVYDKSNEFKTQMFIAARIELFTKLNKLTLLDSDKHLLSDRNFISNAVYQAEKERDIDRIIDLNTSTLKSYSFNAIPHVIVYVKVPYDVIYQRYLNRKNPDELDDFISIEENYLRLQNYYEKALEFLSNRYNYLKIIRIDHTYEIDKIVQEIDSHLESLSSKLNKK